MMDGIVSARVRPARRAFTTITAATVLVAASAAMAQQPAPQQQPRQAQQQQQQQQRPAQRQQRPAQQQQQPAQQQPAQQAAPAQPPQQQGEAPQLIYSPWTKFCIKPPDPNAKQVCFTGKDARIESGMPVVAAVLIEPEGDQKKILRVTLPLGMQLVHGTRVIIDANTPAQAPYVICFTNGCMADYEANADLVNRLKKGQNLTVQAINATAQPLTLQLPLGDFAKAYDGPPTDPKVFEEQQKKLQEELQRRAEDARKRLESQQGQAGQPAPAPTPR